MPILFCLNISFFCGLKLFKINFKLMAKCLSLNFGRRLKGQKMPRMIRQIINKTRMCIFCPLPPILFLMDGSTFICFCISYIYQKQMHLTRFCSHLEVCTLKIKAVSNVDNNNGIYHIHCTCINIQQHNVFAYSKKNNSDVEFYFELFTSWKTVWITISVALDQTCTVRVHPSETCSWGLAG